MMTLSNHQTSFALLREKAGMTIEDVMDLTGKSKSTVYRWGEGADSGRQAGPQGHQ